MTTHRSIRFIRTATFDIPQIREYIGESRKLPPAERAVYSDLDDEAYADAMSAAWRLYENELADVLEDMIRYAGDRVVLEQREKPTGGAA